MRKLFLIFFILICVKTFGFAEVIRGSISSVEVPEGFWGKWHVTSLMESSNNPDMFNKLSVDFWTLSGGGNGVLSLANEMTGAISTIKITKENIEGLKLRFERRKEEYEGDILVRQIESPEITLNGNVFQGYDTFIIEKYKNGVFLSKDIVKYKVVGQKLQGSN